MHCCPPYPPLQGNLTRHVFPRCAATNARLQGDLLPPQTLKPCFYLRHGGRRLQRVISETRRLYQPSAAITNQQLHNALVTMHCSHLQRRVSVSIRGVDVTAADTEQHLQMVDDAKASRVVDLSDDVVAATCAVVQWGATPTVTRVYQRTASQQEANRFCTVVAARQMQRGCCISHRPRVYICKYMGVQQPSG